MEREELLRQLAAWRDGVDPATGATLPPDHPAQRTDFLRVLCAAIDALGAARMREAAPASGASHPGGHARSNAGRPWPAGEDALLAQAHEAGMTIAELARAHERTTGAVTARLVKLGRIAMPPGLRLRGMPDPASAEAPP